MGKKGNESLSKKGNESLKPKKDNEILKRKKDNEILNPRYRKRYALGRVIAKSPYRIRLLPARPSKVCSNFICLEYSCISCNVVSSWLSFLSTIYPFHVVL